MKCKGTIKSIQSDKLYVNLNKIDRRRVNDLYIINFSSESKFINCKLDLLIINSEIEIEFSGIVLLSMPPQIFANKIRLM